MDAPKIDTSEWALQHGEILQNYRIVRPIRSSLKWTAYLARDDSGKRVTLTYIERQRIVEQYQLHAFQNGTPIETAEAEAARYVREQEKTLIDTVERIRGLGDEHVAATHGWRHDKERDQLVIVSDYTPGVDLAYAADRLTPQQLIYIFAQVLDGLGFIHQNGFLHLNLKPSRIVIDFEPDEPVVRITDFGFAIPMKGCTGDYAGTALYMAPEAVLNQRDRIGTRADLFSFGVTMFEALTGRGPLEHRIDARSDKARLAAIVSREPNVTTPPSHFNREVMPALDRIVLDLLHKDPDERRYDNADDLAAAFREQWPEECLDMARAGTTSLSSYD
jgi:serine/threonine protein kinase